jgi:hypothetical protein
MTVPAKHAAGDDSYDEEEQLVAEAKNDHCNNDGVSAANVESKREANEDHEDPNSTDMSSKQQTPTTESIPSIQANGNSTEDIIEGQGGVDVHESNEHGKDEEPKPAMEADLNDRQNDTTEHVTPSDGVAVEELSVGISEQNETHPSLITVKNESERDAKNQSGGDSRVVLQGHKEPHEAAQPSQVDANQFPESADCAAAMDVDLPPVVPEPPARIVSSCDDDEGGSIFAAFTASHSKKGPKKKPLRVKISIAVPEGGSEDEKKDDAENYNLNPLLGFRCDLISLSVDEEVAQTEAELEDSLSFFRDSHEDQDPAFATFIKSQKRKEIEADLKALDLEDDEGRQEIDAVIRSMMKTKQSSTDEQFEKYKAKKSIEEKQATMKLQSMFNEKVTSNQAKINQGIEVLKKRHAMEGQRFLTQHRQQVAQRNLPEHLASQEWANLQQQLNNKHKRQVQEFMGKGDEVKKRTEAEYRREMTKIRSQYEKQVQDVESNRRAIYQKIYAGYQQVRQRYIKRHLQKLMVKRESLERALGDNDVATTLESESQAKDCSKSSKEEEVALRPPSPIKSSGDGLDTCPFEKAGAAARHKHRKGVLSQIAKQMSVEIHNEGVWMAVLQEKKEEKKKEQANDPHTESDQKLFLPWGIKSRDFLESIICGEIPSVLESGYFNFGESVAVNGGHLRCVLTDLRTSDDTARMQRVQAAGEQPNIETATLEQKALELQTAYNNADKAHAKFEKDEKDIIPQVKEAMQDYEAKKLHWENFRSKFAKFLGAGAYKYTNVELCTAMEILTSADRW